MRNGTLQLKLPKAKALTFDDYAVLLATATHFGIGAMVADIVGWIHGYIAYYPIAIAYSYRLALKTYSFVALFDKAHERRG